MQVFDFDSVEGQPYIVMEYLKGPSLSAYLRNIRSSGGRSPLNMIGRILLPLSSALDYAHEQGVIHHGVKPGNILLNTKSGEPFSSGPLPEDVEPILTDYGLVRIVHSATRTISGAVSGTPAYMSAKLSLQFNYNSKK